MPHCHLNTLQFALKGKKRYTQPNSYQLIPTNSKTYKLAKRGGAERKEKEEEKDR
jgi:hypothetical protein